MNVTKEYSIAYVQVLEVLKGLSKKEFDRIPKERIEIYKNNKDPNYHFELDRKRSLDEQISDTAQAIIANLFVQFIATPEDRKKIYEEEKQEFIKQELEKQKKVKINPIFNEKKVNSMPEKQANAIIVKKKGIFDKIFDKLKKIFAWGKNYE